MRNPFPRVLSKLESKERLKTYLWKLLIEDLPVLKEDILPDSLIDKYDSFKSELRGLYDKTSMEYNKLKDEERKEILRNHCD